MHDDEELPETLLKSTELLRELPLVRDEWRRDLQTQLDSRSHLSVQPLTPARRRQRTISLPVAIAACLACTVIGGMAVRMIPRGSEQAVSAVTPASTASLPVRFDLDAPGATRVTIVGDFNKWNAEALPMRRSADGRRWEVEVRLPPGRYTYGFVVDGRLTRDPGAPQTASDDFGIPSSVIMVSRPSGAT